METVDGQIFSYQSFLKNFVTNVNPEDQLPVRINNSNITRVEVIGAVIDWILQYLNSWKCPQTLVSAFAKVILDDIRPKLDPSTCPHYEKQQGEYSALPLMQYVISVIRSVCQKYLESNDIGSLPVSNSYHYYSISASKNRRRCMEDSHVIINDLQKLFNLKDCGTINYYAVFDGHNGVGAALYSATHLHQYLAESTYYPVYPEQALCEAFKATDRHLLEKKDSALTRSGTTAVCVLWHKSDQMLYVAWAGDSEAVLARKGRVYRLVEPHRADREDEKIRIKEAGGLTIFWGSTWRVNGQLAVTRAIGDQEHKSCVTANPDVKSIPLEGDEDFVILACDGLWDSVTPEEAANAVYEHVSKSPDEYDEVSQILVQLAKSQRSDDNITVIVVYLTDPHKIELTKAEMETATAESFSTKQNGSSYCTLNNLQGTFDPDDDFGPETNIDAIDDGLLSQPVSTKKSFTSFESLNNGLIQTAQNDAELGSKNIEIDTVDNKNVLSDESDEDEWNYIKGEGSAAGADSKTNSHDESSHSAESNSAADALQEMDHKLNPDAAVFVPVSPTSVKSANLEDSSNSSIVFNEYAAAAAAGGDGDGDGDGDGSDIRARVLPPLPNDEFVASSPLKGQEKSMENVDVPALNVFDREIRKRPSNILTSSDPNSDSESSIWNDDDVCPLKKDDLDLSMVQRAPGDDTCFSTAAVFGDESCLLKNMEDVNDAIAAGANEDSFSSSEQPSNDIPNKFSTSNGIFDNEDYPSMIEKDVSADAFNFGADKFDFEKKVSDISGPKNDNPVDNMMRDFQAFVDSEPAVQAGAASLTRSSPFDELLSEPAAADGKNLTNPFASVDNEERKGSGADDTASQEEKEVDVTEHERVQSAQSDEIDFLNDANVKTNAAAPASEHAFFDLNNDETKKYSPFACNDEFVVKASNLDDLSNEPAVLHHQLPETKSPAAESESTPAPAPAPAPAPTPLLTTNGEQSLSAQILSDDEIVQAERESRAASPVVDDDDAKSKEEPPCLQYDAETPYVHDCTRMDEKPDSVHHEHIVAKRYADLLPDLEAASTMESDKLESELRGSESIKSSFEAESKDYTVTVVEEPVSPPAPTSVAPEIVHQPPPEATITNDVPSAPELTETVAPAVDAVIAEARKEVKKSVIKKPAPAEEKTKAAPAKFAPRTGTAAAPKPRPASGAASKATTEVKKANATSTTKTAPSRTGLTAANRAPTSKVSSLSKVQVASKTAATATTGTASKSTAAAVGVASKTSAPKLSSPSKSRLAPTAKTNGDVSSSTTKPAITARRIAPTTATKKSPTETGPAAAATGAKPSVNLATRTSLAPRPKPLAPTSPEKAKLASRPTAPPPSRRPISAPTSKTAVDATNKRAPTTTTKSSPLKTSVTSKTESKMNSGLKKTTTNSPTAVKKLSSTPTSIATANQSSVNNSEHQN